MPRGLHAQEVTESSADGFYKVEVGTITELLHERDGLCLIGALQGSNPGKSTTIKYNFITPAGIGTTGEQTVDLPSWLLSGC